MKEQMRFKKITDTESYYEWIEEKNKMLSDENRKLRNENMEFKNRIQHLEEVSERREERYFNLMEEHEALLDEQYQYESKYDDIEDKIGNVAMYWGRMMPMMAMEEAGEFIQAISKYERWLSDEDLEIEDSKELRKELRNNIVKEMADMVISIKALMYKYNIDDERVENAINDKLVKKY